LKQASFAFEVSFILKWFEAQSFWGKGSDALLYDRITGEGEGGEGAI